MKKKNNNKQKNNLVITVLVPKKGESWKIATGGNFRPYWKFTYLKTFVERKIKAVLTVSHQRKIHLIVDYGQFYGGKRNYWTNKARVDNVSDAVSMIQYFCEDYIK